MCVACLFSPTFGALVFVPQRIRAEAAERSRLSRKADRAVRRESKRVEEQGQEQEPQQQQQLQQHPQRQQPQQPTDTATNTNANTDNNTHNITHTSTISTLKGKLRETAQLEVEAKLEAWRRKRARAEAGLPGEPNDNSEKNTGYCPTGSAAWRPWLGEAEPMAGGGRRVCASTWPRIVDAKVRRSIPNEGLKVMEAFFLGGGGGGGGGGGDRGIGWGSGHEEDNMERWMAPWMLGCVERSGTGGVGNGSENGDNRGSDCGNLFGNDGGNDCGNDCNSFCGSNCGNLCGIFCINGCGNLCGNSCGNYLHDCFGKDRGNHDIETAKGDETGGDTAENCDIDLPNGRYVGGATTNIVDLVTRSSEEEALQALTEEGKGTSSTRNCPLCGNSYRDSGNSCLSTGSSYPSNSYSGPLSQKGAARGRGIEGGGGGGFGDEGGGAVAVAAAGGRGGNYGDSAGEARLVFSELHHEIVRFSEYVSLTPSEVRVEMAMGCLCC